ncbi:hypothetical protein ACH4SP_21525 [Streptomyces sp. NPDC021093]|uniref:hypothetical protein n=1 Tax=Streptomyces sp. NPDC021093 TaxID=3365112 RepID=UPI00379DBF4F
MRRGLIHAGAWLLATGAAVTFSWWGVHTVMAGTAYDPPRALPIPGSPPEPGPTAQASRPRSSSTHRPSQSQTPSAKKPASPAPGRRSPSSAPPASGSRTPSPPVKPSGAPRSVNTDAGRVVFSMGKDSATLVSATPASGWAMQVWKDPSWIRVEFTAGAARLSVFCTWYHHEPMIETIKS